MTKEKKLETLKVFLTISPFFKQHKKIIILGILFIFLNSAFSILSPWVLKIGIDDLKINITLRRLALYSFLIILITFLHGIFRFAMRKLLISFSRVFEYQLHNNLYEHILKLPQSFYIKNYTGDIMAKITNDVHAVRMSVGPALMYSINSIFTSLFAIYMMIKINPKLTLFSLIPLPIISFIIFKVGKSIRSSFEKVQEKFSELSVKSQENFNGIREIKAFARENKEVEEFKIINEHYLKANKELIKIHTFINPFFILMLGLSLLIILWIGGIYVIERKITLGSFVAFNSYLMLLGWPAIASGWVINLLQRGAASLKRINELLQEKPVDKFQGFLVLPSEDINNKLEIKNLSFSYDHKKILKDVNLIANPKETILITGHTASGKSTLLKLILKQYPYQEGEILFNGYPLKEIQAEAWMNIVGYVPQDPFLFSDTIENNVKMGSPNEDEVFLIDCLKIAAIYDEIQQMPQGIKTLIGERGITLSGGQKQRLTLARALFKKPYILLLDDPFSQIDINTEYLIWNNLKNYPYSKIKIIISQRIHSLREADKILLFSDGSIIEEGDHEILMAKRKYYYNLIQKQLIEEKLKG